MPIINDKKNFSTSWSFYHKLYLLASFTLKSAAWILYLGVYLASKCLVHAFVSYNPGTAVFFNYRLLKITSHNDLFIVWLFVWNVLRSGLNLFERLADCVVLRAVGVQVSHGGFPLISHHTPAVIPTLWREGICHLAARFPLLSQERGWALIYCEVSPGSLNLHAYRITEWRKRLTTRMTFSGMVITQASARTD